jgi:hypothetical protein
MVSICNLVDDCDAETDSSLEIVLKRSTNPSDTATACTSEIKCPKGEARLGVYSSGFPSLIRTLPTSYLILIALQQLEFYE